MKTFVKIENPEIAAAAAAHGFKHIFEQINGKQVWSFEKTPELMAFLAGRFENIQCSESHIVCF